MYVCMGVCLCVVLMYACVHGMYTYVHCVCMHVYPCVCSSGMISVICLMQVALCSVNCKVRVMARA